MHNVQSQQHSWKTTGGPLWEGLTQQQKTSKKPTQQKRNTAGKPWTGNTVQNEARHNGAGHGTATAGTHTNSSQHTGNPTPVTADQTASAWRKGREGKEREGKGREGGREGEEETKAAWCETTMCVALIYARFCEGLPRESKRHQTKTGNKKCLAQTKFRMHMIEKQTWGQKKEPWCKK